LQVLFINRPVADLLLREVDGWRPTWIEIMFPDTRREAASVTTRCWTRRRLSFPCQFICSRWVARERGASPIMTHDTSLVIIS